MKEFGRALEGEDVLAHELEREASEALERVAVDPSKVISDDWNLPESDRRELARPERQQVIREMTSESFANGIWGWVDDDLSFLSAWGFDVSEIDIPARIIYGAKDVLTPPQHGEWLARNVPHAEVVVEQSEGHLPDPRVVIERYRWLVASA